jgi:hypothetical protein
MPTPEEFRQRAKQRKYYLKIKVPAVERLFDYIKGEIGPQAGLVPEAPGSCPIGTDPWLIEEYTDLQFALERMQLEISGIENLARALGSTIEDFE